MTERIKQLRRVNDALARLRGIEGPFGARYARFGPLAELDELSGLPFTTREDLESAGPLGVCAVPREQLLRVHASSGSRGAPLLVPYTRADLNLLTELVMRALAGADVGRGDVYQNAKSYGLFTGGLAFHEAATRLGVTVVPTSIGRTNRQLELLELLGVTVLGALPSYCLRLIEAADERGQDLRKLPVRALMLGAEQLTEPLRDELENRFGAAAFNGYGLAEVIGPGVAAECSFRTGMHIWEDHFPFEVIDPSSGEAVADGEVGEFVVSAPSKQAMPLLRYRTRDLVLWTREPCPCGSPTARILRVVGRSDDMLTVAGVCVFPAEIERLLLGSGLAGPEWFIAVDAVGEPDPSRPVVHVEEPTPESPAQRAHRGQQLEQLLRDGLGVRLSVNVAAYGSLPRGGDGKTQRVRAATAR